jgi:hypothetical protein
MPTEWPDVVLLDKLPIHVRSKTGKQGGTVSFNVLAALDHETGLVCRVAVSRRSDARAWTKLLHSLTGEPLIVVTDAEHALLGAVRSAWPNATHYPCVHHLKANVTSRLRKAGLNVPTNPVVQALDGAFTSTWRYYLFQQTLRHQISLFPVSSDEGRALARVARWDAANEATILRNAATRHEPESTGALEAELSVISGHFGERGANLKNLKRVEHLVTLYALRQRGDGDAREWASVLREYHEATGGAPPPRRRVDNPALRTH